MRQINVAKGFSMSEEAKSSQAPSGLFAADAAAAAAAAVAIKRPTHRCLRFGLELQRPI